MAHLTDEQAAAAARGEHDPAHAAHLAACGACAARVDGFRETLREVAGVDVPEPSPLFWTSFGARVSEAIDAPAPRRAWWAAPGLAWAGIAGAAILVVAVASMSREPQGAPPPVAVAGGEAGAPVGTSDPSTDAARTVDDAAEDDEAWELVRSVASDVHYDDVLEAGVAPRPGSVERAAVELADEERAELVRLIQDELKRMGV